MFYFFLLWSVHNVQPLAYPSCSSQIWAPWGPNMDCQVRLHQSSAQRNSMPMAPQSGSGPSVLSVVKAPWIAWLEPKNSSGSVRGGLCWIFKSFRNWRFFSASLFTSYCPTQCCLALQLQWATPLDRPLEWITCVSWGFLIVSTCQPVSVELQTAQKIASGCYFCP